MGVSGGTAGSCRKERDDGGEVCHSSQGSHYEVTEDPEFVRDLEILESMLGEGVHG